MFSRLGHILLIVALLGATGAHWAALQSVAWATMLADHAREGSIPQALVKTFDGKHPCALCKQIARGRQSEKKSVAQVELKRLEFVTDSTFFVLKASSDFSLPAERAPAIPLRDMTPPVPPPRTVPT